MYNAKIHTVDENINGDPKMRNNYGVIQLFSYPILRSKSIDQVPLLAFA